MKSRQFFGAVLGLLVMALFGCVPDVEIPHITIEEPFVSPTSPYIIFKASASPVVYDQCGFYISKDPQMLQETQFVAQLSSSFSVDYRVDMVELGSTIYYRAFVRKGDSMAKSEVWTLKIPQFSQYVTLAKPQVSMEKNGKAKVTFQINWAAGISLIEQGVCYSTEFSSPTYFNSYVERADIQNSTCTIQLDLISGKTYYLCGYARSNYHVAYSVPIVYVVPVLLPTVTTSAVNSITATTAQAGGSVTNTGSSDVSARGVVWSKNPEPTISLSTKTKDGTGTGTFASKMTGLNPGTQYYVRAYATNDSGTSYGEQISFTTDTGFPVVKTDSAVGCSYTNADVYGEVVSDGGFSVSQRGFVWSTSPSPTIQLSTKTKDGSGTGKFTGRIDGLTPGTKYFFRAYATNSMGTAYGDEYSFTTIPLPTVTTADISSITSSSAVSGGTATSSFSIRAKGVVWNTSPSPTVSLSTKTNEGAAIGSFTSHVTGLQPGTRYYLRAYATCDAGTAYGEEITFTTTVNLPTVVMRNIGLTHSSASVESEVASDGGSAVTARGVVWSTSPSPTINLSTKTYDGSGTGLFGSSISGLKPETEYYVRAYATNSAGTAYSTQWNIKTPSDERKTAMISAIKEMEKALVSVNYMELSKNDSVCLIQAIAIFSKAREAFFVYDGGKYSPNLNYFYYGNGSSVIDSVKFSNLTYDMMRVFTAFRKDRNNQDYSTSNSAFANIINQLLGPRIASIVASRPPWNMENFQLYLHPAYGSPAFYNLYSPGYDDGQITRFYIYSTGEEYFAP